MTRRDAAAVTLMYLGWLGAAWAINGLTTGARDAQDLLHAWVRFDGIYFRVIAEHGYAEGSNIIRIQQGFPFLTAVFPLLPLLIHWVAPLIGGDYTLASVAVPQVLTWLVLLALFRLVRIDFSRTAAYLSVAALLTFPVFYFLLAPYSETVFLLLAILTFDFYQRGKFGAAGIAGALVGAARIVGAPLVMGALGGDVLYKVWREWRGECHVSRVKCQVVMDEGEGDSSRSLRMPEGGRDSSSQRTLLRMTREVVRRGWWLGVVPVGVGLYVAYQWWAFGDGLMFLRGHASTEWKVGFDVLGPLRGLLLPVYTLFAHDWTGETFRTNLFNAAFLYAAIGVLVYAWRRLPLAYNLYGALAIVVPMFSGTLISMPRFLLISFPLFVGLGLWLEGHRRWRWVVLTGLAAAGLVGTHLFFRTVFLG